MPKHAKTKGSSITAASSTKTGKRVRSIPFAKGFKHRDYNACRLALGFAKSDNIPREFSYSTDVRASKAPISSAASSGPESDPFFNTIPHPTSQDDWLAQYDEDGQTYSQFLEENPWMSSRKVKYVKQQFCSEGKTLREKYPDGKVCIVQLGKFDNKSINFADIVDYSSRFLCMPVEELPPLDLEVAGGKVFVLDDHVSLGRESRSLRVKRTELLTRHNLSTGHVQLRVDSVLSKLRRHIPSHALCLIALTTMDLYGDASDLFVAGMAAGLQRVAVFSLLRYDPGITFSKEKWYDIRTIAKPIPDSAKACLMVHRSCKLVVHEILHLLGVDHCVFFDCCMNGSGHLEEDFRQPMHLCPVDLRKLHTLVGFDVCGRYRSLGEFYHKHGLSQEAEWVTKRLEFLTRS